MEFPSFILDLFSCLFNGPSSALLYFPLSQRWEMFQAAHSIPMPNGGISYFYVFHRILRSA
jgi:hypothetical protein